jgi:hypothetical protein
MTRRAIRHQHERRKVDPPALPPGSLPTIVSAYKTGANQVTVTFQHIDPVVGSGSCNVIVFATNGTGYNECNAWFSGDGTTMLLDFFDPINVNCAIVFFPDSPVLYVNGVAYNNGLASMVTDIP